MKTNIDSCAKNESFGSMKHEILHFVQLAGCLCFSFDRFWPAGAVLENFVTVQK